MADVGLTPWRQALEKHVADIKKNWNKPDADMSSFEYSKQRIDLQVRLANTTGPIVDICGPTHDHTPLNLDLDALNKPFISVNIKPTPFHSGDGKVDIQADGRKLPLTDASAGLIYIAGSPFPIRNDLITEAERALEPGGFLIVTPCEGKCVTQAEKLGMEVVKIWNVDDSDPGDRYDVVLEKPRL